MRHQRRAVLAVTASLALLAAPAVALAGPAAPALAPLQPWLADSLAASSPTADHRVFVHSTSATAARNAATAAGLSVVETFDKVGVAVASGPATAVQAVRRQAGVSYVEGDRPVAPLLETSHQATRGAEAVQTLRGADGAQLDGRGVGIAIIDSGVDGTHPFFRLPDGSSKVVRNLKSVCVQVRLNPNDSCFADVPGNDSDTGSAGGHGTHVAGIAAGVRTTLADGRTVQGAAPGATLVSLSVGQTISVYGGSSGLNWVLDHYAQPCGPAVSAAVCPPIRVTNNSYGPPGGSAFDPQSVTVKLQRALLAEGVLTVWAAGNDGGDGSGASQTTNGPGNDPTPGILMVASYNDEGTGTRDGSLSGFSSRGVRGKTDTYPDISAPGDTILSSCRPYLAICNSSATVPVNGPGQADIATFNTISGTSMAAPHIAGIVAQLLQAKPTATPADVENALEDGAHRFVAGAPYEPDPLNPGSPTSFDKGHGLVDVVAAYGVLTGTPVAAPPTAACGATYTDPRGDATNLLGTPGVTPNDPALDIVGGSLTTTSAGVELAVRMADLTSGPAGQIVEQTFNVRGKDFYLLAQRATPDGKVTVRYGDYGGTQGTRRTLGTSTGSFDDAKDTVTALFPKAAVSPALTSGDVLGGLKVTTRRDGVVVIPDADTAAAGCPYPVGSTTA